MGMNALYGRLNSAPWSVAKVVEFPLLAKGQLIPRPLQSDLRSGHKAEAVALGHISAVATILRGAGSLWHQDGELVLQYSSRSGTSNLIGLSWNAHGREWLVAQGAAQAVGLLILAEAVLYGQHPGVQGAWQRLRTAFTRLGAGFDAAGLDHPLVASSHDVRDALLGLSSEMHWAFQQAQHDLIELKLLDQTPTALLEAPKSLNVLATKPAAPATQQPANTLAADLAQLIKAGQSALLRGPRGVGKTKLACEAALLAGAQLISFSCTPSVERSDLIGCNSHLGTGWSWLDEPLAVAVKKAQAGKVVLLFNDLPRLRIIEQSALIGLLNPYNEQELAALDGVAHPPGSYYRLLLNGQVLVCPAANLCVIATSNLDAQNQPLGQYFQTGGINAAIGDRLPWKFDLEHLDDQLLLGLYGEIAGVAVAEQALALERWSRSQGEWMQPWSTRLMQAFLKGYVLFGADHPAWHKAATYTLIPAAETLLIDDVRAAIERFYE
jgi:hypothetical protein